MRTPDTHTCRHCARVITLTEDGWEDQNATGEDYIWRLVCDSNETFTGEHEPRGDQ